MFLNTYSNKTYKKRPEKYKALVHPRGKWFEEPEKPQKKCGNCGKAMTSKYVKCWDCKSFLDQANDGDKCNVCAGVIVTRDGQYGKFKTCNAWKMHPGVLKKPVKIQEKQEPRIYGGDLG